MAAWSVVNLGALFPGLDLAAEHYHPEKLDSLKRLSSSGRAVSSVARPIRQMLNPRAEDETPVFDLGAATNHVLQVVDAQSEDRVSTKKVCRAGDIIVSRLRSYLRQVAIVPPEVRRAYLSTEFIVLRGQRQKEVGFLLPFILSGPVQTILAWSQDGSEHPRFNERVLLGVTIPAPVLAMTEELNEFIAQAAKAYAKGRTAFANAEALFVSALGLDKLDLTPRLFYERPYAEVQTAARFDAEYFQPAHEAVIDCCRDYSNGWATIGDLMTSIVNGVECREFVDHGVPYLRVGDIDGLRINTQGARTIADADARSLRSKISLKTNDVVMVRSGSIGQAAVVPAAAHDSILSSHLIRLRPNEPVQIRPLCLALLLSSPVGIEQTKKHNNGAVVPELSQSALKQFVVPLLCAGLQNEIEALIRQSHDAADEARGLVDEAKALVEDAILPGRP